MEPPPLQRERTDEGAGASRARRPEPGRVQRYAVAVAAVALAGVLNWVAWEWIKPQGGPFFLLAVMAAAWYGGMGPGLLATVLATLARAIFYREPIFSPLLEWDDLPMMPGFLGAALLIGWLTATRRRAEDGLWQAQAELETRVEARTAELADANRQLRAEIEERKRAEQEQARLQASLRRVETMSAMGALVAGLAHQVRNRLFGISSVLDAMEARLGPREEYRHYSETLRVQLDRLTELVRELLEYGQSVDGERAPGSLRDLIDEAAGACAALAEQAGVTIANRVPAEMAPVVMNAPRLVIAFENLLQNAVQHSRQGGAVRVEASALSVEGERWVECAVRDAGPGFEPDDLPHVFEPFFTRRRGGTGLGLAIVQRIVEEHGGTITAANGPDGGAVLVVRLPASSAPSPRANIRP